MCMTHSINEGTESYTQKFGCEIWNDGVIRARDVIIIISGTIALSGLSPFQIPPPSISIPVFYPPLSNSLSHFIIHSIKPSCLGRPNILVPSVLQFIILAGISLSLILITHHAHLSLLIVITSSNAWLFKQSIIIHHYSVFSTIHHLISPKT